LYPPGDDAEVNLPAVPRHSTGTDAVDVLERDRLVKPDPVSQPVS
jgi:hypothetical protein